ncbi:hypothetical protein DY000_02022099 [Brassica cretica]|uniref:Uncharacterized protein n=1 Tax=Brassica cretica TaxID=69181 RepID=A0ABQ7EHU4_BRACR|nr:hypothetical protein DY000_02022099 [Brassica cretica]
MMKASSTTLLDYWLVVSFLCSERCNNIDSSGTGDYYLEPLAVALDKEKWSMYGYESSSDQESYSLRQVQIDNAFVSRVCSETAGRRTQGIGARENLNDQRTKIGSNQPLTIQTVSVQSSLCLSLSAMMKASSTTLLDSRFVVSFLCSERCNNIDSSGTGDYYLEPLAVALDKEKWSMIGSLHVFTNVSDGYESSSDQESYSETSSGKLSKIDNVFVSRVFSETAGGLPYLEKNTRQRSS